MSKAELRKKIASLEKKLAAANKRGDVIRVRGYETELKLLRKELASL